MELIPIIIGILVLIASIMGFNNALSDFPEQETDLSEPTNKMPRKAFYLSVLSIFSFVAALCYLAAHC